VNLEVFIAAKLYKLIFWVFKPYDIGGIKLTFRRNLLHLQEEVSSS